MKYALIGAGAFANEIRAHMKQNLKCFVDDKYYRPNNDNISPLSEFDPTEYKVAVAVGHSGNRKLIVDRLPKETQYFTFIHPTAQIIGDDVFFGEGSLVCAGVIVTTNCIFGKHTHLNLHTSIGHDNLIGDYFTTAPGARVSGNCYIGNVVYFGTNACTKQKVNICDNVTIGLNSGVVKDITIPGVYTGTPAKFLKNE